jgi:hypothetical protein
VGSIVGAEHRCCYDLDIGLGSESNFFAAVGYSGNLRLSYRELNECRRTIKSCIANISSGKNDRCRAGEARRF